MRPSIGILGLGYLGEEVARLAAPMADLWAASRSFSPPAEPQPQIESILFQWDDPTSWHNLPDLKSTLVITMPPLCDDAAAEKDRLLTWCQWLNKNRRNYQSCLYISSTGVYPNLPGVWTEESPGQSDSRKGSLRRVTEEVLANHFKTIVIRPGAIYGSLRNIGQRLLAGKPIPQGKQPVHRIHVHDLARLVLQAAQLPDFPTVVNAVDLKAETSKAVVQWLIEQPFFPTIEDQTIKYSQGFGSRKFALSEADRTISNQRLLEECRFKFIFPTYREGLKHAFAR